MLEPYSASHHRAISIRTPFTGKYILWRVFVSDSCWEVDTDTHLQVTKKGVP
jgi:hypothetical protein